MPCSDCSPTFTALEKLTECDLLSRTRFNHAPVASERIELTELISQAEKDLIRYEETIARLQERIVALKNEQKGLNRQVCLAKSLMAPIRQLPPELLRQIFIAHGVQNIIGSPRCQFPGLPFIPPRSEIPGLKLTSICSHWRSIAVDTTALWNVIHVLIDNHYTKSDSLLPLTERLLALSQNSLLSISICTMWASRETNSTISVLVLLCDHANRWQCLEGDISSFSNMQTVIKDTLASIRGRLDNLHTFKLHAPFDCSRLVEGALKLHTLSIREIDARSTITPWNQIVNLDVRDSRVLSLAESLWKMPNLLSLALMHFYPEVEDEVREYHSNLKYLKISINEGEDEEGMEALFESFTLPQLQSLYIEVETEYLTSQNNRTWSSLKLPSLITRSSALITSFSLCDVWIATSNLISLLRIMPALTSLFLSESSYKGREMMINDQLLSMLVHHDQDQQPILTRLISLNLEVSSRALFSIPTFVEMIHSRWKPACLDDVACIKTVRLFAHDFTIAPKTVRSLMALWKRGLDVTIEDEDGVVMSTWE